MRKHDVLVKLAGSEYLPENFESRASYEELLANRPEASTRMLKISEEEFKLLNWKKQRPCIVFNKTIRSVFGGYSYMIIC